MKPIRLFSNQLALENKNSDKQIVQTFVRLNHGILWTPQIGDTISTEYWQVNYENKQILIPKLSCSKGN